jgi:hypothetical protein
MLQHRSGAHPLSGDASKGCRHMGDSVVIIRYRTRLEQEWCRVDAFVAERPGKGWVAKDVFVAHTVSGVQPDVTLPPWMGTEVPEVRRAERDASVATPGVMAMGPRSASALSTCTATGEGVPKERPR